MSYIVEEKKHGYFDITIQVLEKTPSEIENSEPGSIIYIEWDPNRRLTCNQLRSIGKWFKDQSRIIRKEYTTHGIKKVHG